MTAQAGIYYRCHSEFISESYKKAWRMENEGKNVKNNLNKKIKPYSSLLHAPFLFHWTSAFTGMTSYCKIKLKTIFPEVSN